MRLSKKSLLARVIVGSALTVALSATFALSAPAPAQAARAKTISRTRVVDRARVWVKRRVPYSQRRYHRGYRQDCSGFVSMAWKLGRSYTTRTLPRVARRVSKAKLRPGDAVLTSPGHVVIFGGWKNRKHRTFYAYEQQTWGKTATKRVRKMSGRAKGLRRPGIRNPS